jgi:hypothetical protein
MGAPHDKITTNTTNDTFKGYPKHFRFPYEVEILGAVPEGYQAVDEFRKEFKRNKTFTKHPNGGGLVEEGSYVQESVYVAPHAIVCGSSNISGFVQILGTALVKNSDIKGTAVIQDNAFVIKSKIRGGVIVEGLGFVDNVTMSGNAKIQGRAEVSNYKLSGKVLVGGDVLVYNESGSCDNGEYYRLENYFKDRLLECDGRDSNHEDNKDVNEPFLIKNSHKFYLQNVGTKKLMYLEGSVYLTKVIQRQNLPKNQKFEIQNHPRGTVSITQSVLDENDSINLSLSVYLGGISQNPDNALVLVSTNQRIENKWLLEPTNDPLTFKIRSDESKNILIANPSNTSSQIMQSNTSKDDANTKWRLIPEIIEEGKYYIKNVATGKVMSVLGSGTKPGTSVVQNAFNGGNNQKFAVAINGNGYTLRPLHTSGMYLNVCGCQNKNNTGITIWKKYWPVEQFNIDFVKYTADGTPIYEIKSMYSNLSVGVHNSNAPRVMQWNMVSGITNDPRFQWVLVPVSSSKTRELSMENSLEEEEIQIPQIDIFPNPATDIFSVDITGFSDEEELIIIIADSQGNQVLKKEIGQERKLSFDAEALGLKQQTYVIQIHNGSDKRVSKILKFDKK